MLHHHHQKQHDCRQLVRVAAGTAAPILSAMPKCAHPKAPRTRPLDTAHGMAVAGYLQSPNQQQQQRRNQEQVLLIVQDEHSKVPVVGRRLPAKSMPPPPPPLAPNYAQELYLHHRDPEPVQGRRSHRLHQQHHYRQPLYVEQPASHVEKHQQLLVVQHTNYPTGSQYRPSPADYPLKPKGLLRTAKLHRHHPSSSCSSLCSAASTTTTDDLCPSCSPSTSLAPAAAACCRPYGSPLGRATRSASCQRLEPSACLVQVAPAPNGGGHHLKRPSEEALRVMVPLDYHEQQQSQRSHARNLLSQHHHHMCQANETPKKSAYQRASSCHDERAKQHSNQQQPLLISGRNLLPVCPKPAFMVQQQQQLPKAPKSRHQHQCPAEKPPSAALKEPQVEPQVSQMYESLAAELKAKLGDPRLGPILLPPKDYDTMSRRQGKLSGIELRRSTNPQLVGPTAVAGAATTTNNNKLQEQYVHSNKSSGVSSGDSARSSGRSQSDDKSLGSRSRSNSSSGLGSISMNLGSSSTSSPSSQSTSSEDMRCHQQHHGHVVSAASAVSANRFVGTKMAIVGAVDEKQLAPNNAGRVAAIKIGSSPDNGTSSDSGHSESCGPLDSVDGQHRPRAKLSRDAEAQSNNDYVTKPNATNSAKQQHSSLTSLEQLMAKSKGNQDNNHQQQQRGSGIQHHNPSKVSSGVLWNGRVEVPLKVNNDKNGHTYLATKQIIY